MVPQDSNRKGICPYCHVVENVHLRLLNTPKDPMAESSRPGCHTDGASTLASSPRKPQQMPPKQHTLHTHNTPHTTHHTPHTTHHTPHTKLDTLHLGTPGTVGLDLTTPCTIQSTIQRGGGKNLLCWGAEMKRAGTQLMAGGIALGLGWEGGGTHPPLAPMQHNAHRQGVAPCASAEPPKDAHTQQGLPSQGQSGGYT